MAVLVHLLNLSWASSSWTTGVLSVRNSWDVKHTFIKKHDLTYRTESDEIFAIHDWENVTRWEYCWNFNWFTLVIMYGNMRASFSKCSVRWSLEFLNVHLMSSGTLLSANGNWNWLFSSSAQELGAPLTSSAFKILHCWVFDRAEDRGGCRKRLLVSISNVSHDGRYTVRLDVPCITLNIFSTCKGTNEQVVPKNGLSETTITFEELDVFKRFIAQLKSKGPKFYSVLKFFKMSAALAQE